MNDGASEQPRPGGLGVGSDPKIFVATATTVAALLLAGSAYVWRRGSGAMNLAHATSDGTTSQTDTPHARDVSDTSKARLRRDATGKGKANSTGRRASVSAQGGKPLSDDGHATDDGDDLQGGSARQREAAASLGKSSRAKERRRRGKDPMKELMKPGGGKLAKILKETDVSTPSGSGPSRARTTSTSEVQRLSSTLRQQEKSPSDDSSTTQRAGSSSSSTIFPSSSTVSEPTQDQPLTSSPSSSSARSRSKSRSRSRPRNDVGPAIDHEPSTSKSVNRNSDAASTISSASSSTATEASTLSTSSTAPTSLSSSVSGLRVDADATPKADSARTNLGALPLPRSPISQGKKPQHHEASDPWDWDGAGSSSTSPTKPLQSRKSQSKLHKASNLPSSTAEGPPVAYASVVSAKSPKEEDSRSTVGTRTEAKQHMQSSLSSTDDNAETVEAEGNEEEEVPPLVFPSLNNPAPSDTASSSLSASTQSSFSVGSAPASSSSLSRPHSRASNSSSAHPAQIGGLKSKSPAPRSGSSATMTPLSGAGAETPSVGSRRAPTPLGSGKRPATPGSAASSPLLSGSIVPPSPSSQSFGQAGSSSVLSAQTQVASLRGALEASRLRELKQKEEVEKMTKERDMMQWENAAWRRREVELQTQIQQMMHQLQSYNAYFSSLNHGHHPPQVISPPQSTAPTPHSMGAQPISARDNDNADHDDDTPPANAGDPLQIVSPTSAEKDGNDTSGGNSAEKNGDGGGVGEGSAVGQGPSVPGPDSAAASPAEGAVGAEEGSSSQEFSAATAAHAPLKVSTSSLVHPTPIAPTAYNPALSPGVMSPSILHSPMGSFPHYTLHATPPVGFGPHGLPSPMSYPFHMPPHPLQPTHVQQHHPFMAPGSAPQSPGISMMPPQSLAHMNPNPFVVSPAAATFGRPGTPGSLGAMAMLNGHPHPHTPAGMGMGLGNSMTSPFAMAGMGSGTASPDPTGSPSSTTAFLMQDRGRRRMSGGSASGSVLGRSLRGRSSVTLLPLDAGIGGNQGLKRGGKSSSGSSVNGDGSGEEHAVEEEEGDFNEVLASAILKRPETVRMGASRKGSFKGGSSVGDGAVSPASPGFGLASGSVSLNGIWSGYGQGGAGGTESPIPLHQQQNELAEGEDNEERPQEFVFPSLNDVGPAKATLSSSHPGSTSSSVSHSPEAKSPQLRSSTPALGTLMEEDVGEGSMVKSESAPAPLRAPSGEPELVERFSTSH